MNFGKFAFPKLAQPFQVVQRILRHLEDNEK
jgi:hypothetical protein